MAIGLRLTDELIVSLLRGWRRARTLAKALVPPTAYPTQHRSVTCVVPLGQSREQRPGDQIV